MSKTTRKPERLPSIYWHQAAKQYAVKIGYKKNRVGGRVRAYHYLGTDELQALGRARQLQQAWAKVVAETKARAREFSSEVGSALGGEFVANPVWVDDATRQATEGEIAKLKSEVGALPAKLAADLVAVTRDHYPQAAAQFMNPPPLQAVGQDLPIREAAGRFLAYKKAKVGIAEGLKANTYNGIQNFLTLALRGLDASQPLSTLDHTALETFKDGWMRKVRPEAGPQALGTISKRTAVNYCRAFKSMLDWCHRQPAVAYRHPDSVEEIFRFKKANPIDIRDYSHADLNALLGAAPRCKLYILLGLNCGFTQNEIATLKLKHVVEQGGESFIHRRREKTSHQNDFLTLYYLWPETATLLKKYLAPDDPAVNPAGLALLNEEDKPLVTLGGKSGQVKLDNIKSCFYRAAEKSGLKRSCRFKDLRKTGATWMFNNVRDNGQTARLLEAQKIEGTLRQYAKADFAPLTAALKRWREELASAGVVLTGS